MLVTSIFSFSCNVFRRAFYSGSLKVGNCQVKYKTPVKIMFISTICYMLPHTVWANYDIYGPGRVYEGKVDENGKKFSKRVENTVGKGEIASYQQILLFTQCFQKTCNADR